MKGKQLSNNPKGISINFWLSILLCALSAVLLSFAFPMLEIWPFAWIGLVPLLFVLEAKSPVRAFALSYFTGAIFYILTIYWIMYVTTLGFILLVLYLSIYFGIFGLMVAILSKRNYSFYSILLIPCSWVILEFLRSKLLTGFGWAALGYSQYKNLIIAQIADLAGVYIVSFLLVLANVIIKEIIQGFKDKASTLKKIIILILCIIFAVIYGLFRLSQGILGEKLKVSVIQGNVPQELKWQEDLSSYILEKHLILTKEVSFDKPQLIIWPESSVPYLWEEDNLFSKSITDLVKQIKIPVLAGAITVKNDEIFNSAILISKDGRITKNYEKLHLVPFGEYIPWKKLFAFAANFAPVPIGDFTKGRDYTIFSWDNNQTKAKFSVLICFEDVFPELSRRFTKKGANFLINITNDAWFKISSAPYQHLQASVFRAIENRRYVVRAANTGISCFIDSNGRIIDKVSAQGRDIFVSGYKTQDIILNSSNTLYTKLGDIFVLCCFLFVIVSLIIKKYFIKPRFN